MRLQVSVPSDDESEPPELLVSGARARSRRANEMARQQSPGTDCTYRPSRPIVPTFVIADYEVVDRAASQVHYLHGHEHPRQATRTRRKRRFRFITEWFGALRKKAETADLADPNALPFESGSFLLTPLDWTDSKLAGLAAAHQLTHASFFSPRPWINEGLAHFAQALYLEHLSGRQAALDYMGLHRSCTQRGSRSDKSKADNAPPDPKMR